ncbi:MAG: hypothetical protein JWN84_4583, partial [Nocardioides sp.]|nr:hypothetical protein [Nocardioides sp.]
MPEAASPARADEHAVARAVARALDGARLPALVVSDLPLDLTGLDATLLATGEAKPEGHFRTVLLAVNDADELRRAVRRLPGLGWARTVAVVVADSHRVVPLRPDPAWPPLVAVEATIEHTRLEFGDRLEARPVLAALARAATAPAPGRWDSH